MGIFSLMIWFLVLLSGGYVYRFLGGIGDFLCRYTRIPTPATWREIRAARAVRIVLSGVYVLVVGLWWRLGALLVAHLALLGLLTGLLLRLLARLLHRRRALCAFLSDLRRSRLIALLLTIIIAILGTLNMSVVRRTEYTLESDRVTASEGYTVAFLSDLHYGTIQSPSVLEETVAELNALQPDLVILGGDLFEEGNDYDDLEEAFSLLGDLQARDGIYYIYGNHDRQFYSGHPAYTPEDIAAVAERFGITILCDEAVAIGEELLLVGREDLSRSYVSDRTSIDRITEGKEANRFLLVVDHQPSAFSESVAAGADLQLSGHTHAGQIFPGGRLLELFGGYVYGEYREEGTTLIVSSGVAGWGFPFRTERHCEYVLVRLMPSRGAR